MARRGAEAGCHEALFTLGERPEERYPVARAWLDEHGYESTVDYLVAMCRLVVEETGLLPHANAGALYPEELAALRAVAPSQGMMIESLNPDLDCHRGAPDKTPERRLATLEAAGELAIPFTTGILVGIGESRADRVTALVAIADVPPPARPRAGGDRPELPAQAGHRPCTRRRRVPPTTISRPSPWPASSCPPTVHVQAPPNLSTDFGVLLDAGIDDWGGVSPVTADFVNPERPWPALDRLREATEARGLVLAPRLTAYPEFVLDPERWIDPALRFAVLDRSDAEGLGRDDPGAVLPQRFGQAADVGTGAEVVVVGRRSTAWYSGADGSPATLLPGRGVGPGRGGRGPRRRARRSRGRRGRDRHAVRGAGPRGRGRRRGRRRAAPAGGRRRGHVGPQPQHQLHQRLHVQVQVLRVLQGPAVAQPARQAVPARPSTTSPSDRARRGPWAPPRCACRAGSIPASTATTTSTWPRPCGTPCRTSTSTPSPRSRSPRGPSGWASRSTRTCAG